ncbi:MAG: sn-glycerol-3-phosphate ABC transporter ATP-binding protein UgpC [Burkholderiales bacterium]|nr:sn-glycerol-3-phosphate ABC transporter ATP-binding protein UgpC [Burkholderiales bacterium]
MASVRLEHVVRRFGDNAVVNDVTMDIADKEFLVLVGPSGCGKSTILKMIAGLEEVSSGNIYIGERLVNNLAPKDRDVAMVFQNYALYPHMSVFDNMAFGLRLRNVSAQLLRERVHEAAKILDIGPLLSRKPRELSGGQRQRVALGRAIVREPKAFLMDEPLSNLDAKLRVQTRVELSRLHQRLHATMIYVTHDQVEAMTMGTRIAIIRDGVLQQVDSPAQVYASPVNMFVAGFIGSPAMNFFRGRLERAPGSLVVKSSGLSVPLVPQFAARLDGAEPGEVVLGVRPEDVHDARRFAAPEAGPRIDAQVEFVEHMGNENFVHLRSGDASLLARMDREVQPARGDVLPVVVDSRKVHLFDAHSERALLPGSS